MIVFFWLSVMIGLTSIICLFTGMIGPGLAFLVIAAVLLYLTEIQTN